MTCCACMASGASSRFMRRTAKSLNGIFSDQRSFKGPPRIAISACPMLWRRLKGCNRRTMFKGPRSRSTSLMYRGGLMRGSMPSHSICRCWIPETFLTHWQIESRDDQSVGMLVMYWNGLSSNRMNGTLEQSTPWRHGMLDRTSPFPGSEGFEENKIGRQCRKSRTSWKICVLQRMTFSMQL